MDIKLTQHRPVTAVMGMDGRVKDLVPGKVTTTLSASGKSSAITEHVYNDPDTVDRITDSVALYQLLKQNLSEETRKELSYYGIIFPDISNKLVVELLDFKDRVLSCKEALPLLMGLDPEIDKEIAERLK